VIIDDADDDGLAGPAGFVPLGALTDRPVTRDRELRQLERVDGQQRARFGPLIAARGLPGR
jgi:hypothetical protein